MAIKNADERIAPPRRAPGGDQAPGLGQYRFQFDAANRHETFRVGGIDGNADLAHAGRQQQVDIGVVEAGAVAVEGDLVVAVLRVVADREHFQDRSELPAQPGFAQAGQVDGRGRLHMTGQLGDDLVADVLLLYARLGMVAHDAAQVAPRGNRQAHHRRRGGRDGQVLKLGGVAHEAPWKIEKRGGVTQGARQPGVGRVWAGDQSIPGTWARQACHSPARLAGQVWATSRAWARASASRPLRTSTVNRGSQPS